MLAARMRVSTREFALTEMEIPNPNRRQVLIKVMAAGLCLSDVHFLSGMLSPGYLKGDVVTLGHEVSGVIEKLGEDVHDWSVGDRVIICAGSRDEQNRITTLGFDYDGGFAEFTIADSETLVGIPDNLSFEEACIIPDAVSTPWAAITKTAKVIGGESAAVFGVGGLGIHAIQLLCVIGASPIIAIDPLAQARQRALKVGADIVLDPIDPDFLAKLCEATNGLGLNVAFDFAGSGTARNQGLRSLGEGGRLVIVGLANESILIPNDIAFAYKHSQVLGHYGSDPIHTKEMVELVRQGRLDLSGSISEIISLENIEEAFRRLENKIGNPIRIVIQP